MTVLELLTTIREMVPDAYSVTVELDLQRQSKNAEPRLTIRVFASSSTACEMEDGDTCEQVLARFKANVLPALGLVDVPPAEERLAAMGV